MKVYLLMYESVPSEEDEIVGVFSTKEVAWRMAESLAAEKYYYRHIMSFSIREEEVQE